MESGREDELSREAGEELHYIYQSILQTAENQKNRFVAGQALEALVGEWEYGYAEMAHMIQELSRGQPEDFPEAIIARSVELREAVQPERSAPEAAPDMADTRSRFGRFVTGLAARLGGKHD